MFIILDIDNTLLDHSGAETKAATIFGKQHQDRIPGYTQNAFQEEWQRESQRYIELFLQGDLTFQEQRRCRIRAIFKDHTMGDQDADSCFEDYLFHYKSSWETYPDVMPFLSSLDHKVGILSDGAQAQQEEKLEHLGLLPYCSFVLTAEATGLSKPDPRFFHLACERAKVSPSQACYIGDNLQKDAMGACQAGLRGVWINRYALPAPPEVESIRCFGDYQKNAILPDSDE